MFALLVLCLFVDLAICKDDESKKDSVSAESSKVAVEGGEEKKHEKRGLYSSEGDYGGGYEGLWMGQDIGNLGGLEGGSGGEESYSHGHGHHEETKVKQITIEKTIKVPYHVEKKIHVPVEKEVPYPVKSYYPQPYAVEKKVPVPYKGNDDKNIQSANKKLM